jgi:regulator of protease activity HflC (stomatin/prohibitin superfamily)
MVFQQTTLLINLKNNDMISTKKNTKLGVNPIAGLIALVLIGASGWLYYAEYVTVLVLIILLIVSLFIANSVHIADQWEKAIVLRMGKYTGLRGPGLFFTVPLIDKVDNYIDQRVRVTEFKAEQTLTKDTVPVNVDAVVYWTVWDVEKAALEVQDYEVAISYIAQTGLRDVIGKHELAELLQERDKVTDLLQRILDEHTNPWGITCQNVGIKDIVIPQLLADAMSKEAQAERERRARVILGTAETEIAEKFALASLQYVNNPVALHLRGMNMLFEGLKEKGSMVIVPSSALDSMNLGAMGGLISLAKSNEQQQVHQTEQVIEPEKKNRTGKKA